MKKSYTGINIQWPISSEILAGTKTIETRTYPFPPKYVGKPLLLIETPGPKGNFKARIVALVVFGTSFKYSSKEEFYKDAKRHRITPNSPWNWGTKSKWGWPIVDIKKLEKVQIAPRKKGIVFTKDIALRKPAQATSVLSISNSTADST